MSLITIDGQISAGGVDLGRRLSKMLDHDYVDRLVLPGHAPDSENPVEANRRRLSDRIWSLVEKAVRGVALGNAAGDPYFATAELMMYPLTWDSSPGAPMATHDEGNPGAHHTIQSLMERGRSILVQRAGAVALQGHEQVLKIGVFASWEDRISRMMRTQGLSSPSDAERIILEREKAQTDYFGTYHSAHPEDRSLYDICIDTSQEQINIAAVKIARAAAPSPA